MIGINYPLSATFVPDRQNGQEEKTGTFALTMGSFTIYSQEKVIMIGSTEQTAYAESDPRLPSQHIILLLSRDTKTLIYGTRKCFKSRLTNTLR